MCKKRLDMRESFPSGMEDYLGAYGWHFSKRMCEWAVGRMREKGGNKLAPVGKEVVDSMLAKYGVVLDNNNAYDATYVANMARADFFNSSIADEMHLVKFIKDYQDDPDGYDEIAFTRFYADCIGKGEMPTWEDML